MSQQTRMTVEDAYNVEGRVLLVAPDDGRTATWVKRAFGHHDWHAHIYDYRHAVRERAQDQPQFRAIGDMEDHLMGQVSDYDLVLVLKGEVFRPSTLSTISDIGPTTALWHVDPRRETAPDLVERMRACDVAFTIAEGLVRDYQMRGVNAHHLPEGADPRTHAPCYDPRVAPMDPDDVDVAFIGTIENVGDREAWARTLGNEFGDRFHLWGSHPGFAATWHHGRATQAEFRWVCSNATINLGRDRNPEIARSYGARLYRTLACGGFLLTNATEGIREEFGNYVGVYDSTQDCIDMINYYIEEPEHRAHMAAKGRQHVLKNHTFAHRIETLLQVVNL